MSYSPFVHVLVLFSALLLVDAVTKEMYTSNAICRQNFCINPLFPGLGDLPRLEAISWQCPPNADMASYMSFCKEAVKYSPAIPSPNSTSALLETLVKAQDDAASTMFFYHLSGLGYEPWDYQEPHKSTDPCVRASWLLTCYTYFPKAAAGCQSSEKSAYFRPCRTPCESYLAACNVECCDESPQCVFQHTVEVGGGNSLVQTGYVDATAPSALCTGMSGARGLSAPITLILGLLGLHALAGSATDVSQGRRAASVTMMVSPRSSSSLANVRKLAVACVLVSISAFLQGCDGTIPSHTLGNWRAKQDYLVSYAYVPPGSQVVQATLNSCSLDVPETSQCSGRGYCRNWDAKNLDTLSFCSCDRDWADPECRTRRKSQTTTFFLSLFGGFFGLDYFYLGLPLWGITKLCTLGGLGFWWLVDIIRTGSGPVYAHDFRVSADLPHWVYVMVTVFLFVVAGFVFAMSSYLRFRTKKRQDVMALQRAEENRILSDSGEMAKLGPQYGPQGGLTNFAAPRGFSGYGATLPVAMPSANAAYAEPLASGQVGPPAGPYGPCGPRV
mmetsp:Transcript_108102/g.304507  ORF Transcript_108102/g.304507 Transcript_108102/m.304507 type:complete len:557 (-) Transcript_108102:70-1740(-)